MDCKYVAKVILEYVEEDSDLYYGNDIIAEAFVDKIGSVIESHVAPLLAENATMKELINELECVGVKCSHAYENKTLRMENEVARQCVFGAAYGWKDGKPLGDIGQGIAVPVCELKEKVLELETALSGRTVSCVCGGGSKLSIAEREVKRLYDIQEELRAENAELKERNEELERKYDGANEMLRRLYNYDGHLPRLHEYFKALGGEEGE